MSKTTTTSHNKPSQLAELDKAAEKINKATLRLAKSFAQYMATVGPALKKAHELHQGYGSGSWQFWVEHHLTIGKRHANRLLAAWDVMQALQACPVQPSSEAQCRELARVDAARITAAWQHLVQAEATTGAAIRDELAAAGYIEPPPVRTTRPTIEIARELLAQLEKKERAQLLAELEK